MTYRDICFCHASNEYFCKEHNIPICKNTHCIRHASTIPDNLPEWELFAYYYPIGALVNKTLEMGVK